MRITQAHDPVGKAHPLVLIVGGPGVGKTSLGHSFDTLLLDFDKGSHRSVNRRAVGHPDRWADVEATFTERALAPYAGVTIDTVNSALAMITVALCAQSASYGVNGVLTPRGWGELQRRFAQVLTQLDSLGKNVLMLAHAKEVRDGDRWTVRADISGGSFNEVMRRADVVGHLVERSGRRVLEFSRSDRFPLAKSPGWSAMEVPPIAQAGAFMADLFDRYRAAYGVRVSATPARVAAVRSAVRA
jgi:hypothetical protein